MDPSKMKRGTFYCPIKQEITLTLDEYVIGYFEANEPDETDRHEAINKILLDYITQRKFPNWGKVGEPAVQEPTARASSFGDQYDAHRHQRDGTRDTDLQPPPGSRMASR